MSPILRIGSRPDANSQYYRMRVHIKWSGSTEHVVNLNIQHFNIPAKRVTTQAHPAGWLADLMPRYLSGLDYLSRPEWLFELDPHKIAQLQ